MPRLENRKILITGGASGIGRATSELFVREGAAVAVLDRDTARVAGAHAIAADVSDAASVAHAIQNAARTLGGLDGLVNAAGVFINRGLMETTTDEWNTTIAVNLTGTYLCSREAIPDMLECGFSYGRRGFIALSLPLGETDIDDFAAAVEAFLLTV